MYATRNGTDRFLLNYYYTSSFLWGYLLRARVNRTFSDEKPIIFAVRPASSRQGVRRDRKIARFLKAAARIVHEKGVAGGGCTRKSVP